MERIQLQASSKPAATTVAPASSGPLNSAKVFGMMKVYLDRGEGKHLIPKVAAVFGFEILGKKGGPV